MARFAVVPVMVAAGGCTWAVEDRPLTVEAYEAAEEQRAEAQREALDELLAQRLDDLSRQDERLARLAARSETAVERLGDIESELRALRQEQAVSAAPVPITEEEADDAAADEGDDDDEPADTDLAREPAVVNGGEKLVFGAAECIVLPEQGMVLRGRVDTGANTASLNARDIEEFERDGDAWVRFRIPPSGAVEIARDEQSEDSPLDDLFGDLVERVDFMDGGTEEEGVKVEAEVERRVTIVQSSGEEERLVVRLPGRIGSLDQRMEFTLSDRTELDFPVLFGRRLLRDLAVVDVGREYVQPCRLDSE